jgi:hypothetical protein
MSDFYDLELNIRKLCSDAVLRSEKHKNMLCTYYDFLCCYRTSYLCG